MSQNQSNEAYRINVGERDFARMTLLGSIYQPYNLAFLKKHGLKPGCKVADFGCGPGNMSLAIAKEVGAKGMVMALDQSQEQLAIVQQRMQQENISNIVTKQINIYDCEEIVEKFDFVFCRFVILHLSDPILALKKLKTLLKPQGKLINCDFDNSTWDYYPPNDSLKQGDKLHLALAKKLGIDAYIGPKLYDYFKQVGLTDIDIELAQPQLRGEQRQYPIYRIETTKNIYVQNEIITEKEADQLIVGMQEAIANPEQLIVGARMFQVCGSLD